MISTRKPRVMVLLWTVKWDSTHHFNQHQNLFIYLNDHTALVNVFSANKQFYAVYI